MVTPGGGAFLVADGAVVTQVSTSSSKCVHFMQIIAHAKRNRLNGCHAHSAPRPGSALRGPSLWLVAMFEMGFECSTNPSASHQCRFEVRSDCVVMS